MTRAVEDGDALVLRAEQIAGAWERAMGQARAEALSPQERGAWMRRAYHAAAREIWTGEALSRALCAIDALFDDVALEAMANAPGSGRFQ